MFYMRVANNAAYNTAIKQYSRFNDSGEQPERVSIAEIALERKDSSETYPRPKLAVPSRQIVDTSGDPEVRSKIAIQINSHGDTFNRNSERVKRFVEKFGWDKVPPDNLKGVEVFRESRITVINQDGDSLDLTPQTS